MKNVLYIHGAGQSKRSFEYIKKHIPEHISYIPEYTMDRSVPEIVEMFYNRCIGKFENEPIYVIGHSLGGIIGLHLLNTDLNIKKLISVSAPLGGIEGGELLRFMFPFHKLYSDVRPLSETILDLQKIPTDNALGIVTTEGHIPLLQKPNDGAVTIESQKALKNLKYIDYSLNHFEILLSSEFCDKISEFFEM